MEKGISVHSVKCGPIVENTFTLQQIPAHKTLKHILMMTPLNKIFLGSILLCIKSIILAGCSGHIQNLDPP